MWHHNIQVYQCDFYACHYNCHVNSFENSADVTDRIPTRFVFNIKCQMDYDTVNSTTLKNLITMPEYQNKYVFSYTGPIVAGGKDGESDMGGLVGYCRNNGKLSNAYSLAKFDLVEGSATNGSVVGNCDNVEHAPFYHYDKPSNSYIQLGNVDERDA